MSFFKHFILNKCCSDRVLHRNYTEQQLAYANFQELLRGSMLRHCCEKPEPLQWILSDHLLALVTVLTHMNVYEKTDCDDSSQTLQALLQATVGATIMCRQASCQCKVNSLITGYCKAHGSWQAVTWTCMLWKEKQNAGIHFCLQHSSFRLFRWGSKRTLDRLTSLDYRRTGLLLIW